MLISLAVTGCSTIAPALTAPERTQAIEASKYATSLFNRGDYAEAAAQYKRALLLERSIENEEGIAVNLINLSIVLQRMGDNAAALSSLAQIINDRLLQFPAGRVAEAAFRTAVIMSETGDVKGASVALQLAREKCPPSGCVLAGKLLNVQAQLSSLDKDFAGALTLATQALEVNRRQGDSAEEANSLRLLGAALLELGSSDAAQKVILEALAIDKSLLQAHKIMRDLSLLGRVASSKGAVNEAAVYYQRAIAVASAAGDRQTVAHLEQLVKGLLAGGR